MPIINSFESIKKLIELHNVIIKNMNHDPNDVVASHALTNALVEIKTMIDKEPTLDNQILIRAIIDAPDSKLNRKLSERFPSKMEALNTFALHPIPPSKQPSPSWLSHALIRADTDKMAQALAHRTVEFIISEENAVKSILPTHIFLTKFLDHPQIASVDREIINAFSLQLEQLESDYKAINLFDLLTPDTRSVNEVIEQLCEKYQSEAFHHYQASLENLLVSADLIRMDLAIKYNISNVINNSISPIFQRTMRIGTLLKELQKDLSKHKSDAINASFLPLVPLVDQAVRTSQNRIAAMQGTQDLINYGLYQVPEGSEERKGLAYQALLGLDQLTFPDTYSKEERDSHLSRYFTRLLPEVSIPSERNDLNPEAFNSQELTEQAQLTHNPAYLILKSQIPISDTFTLLDKVEAYKHVIELIKSDELVLNNEKPIKQARIVAETLLSVIQEAYTNEQAVVTPELIVQLELIEPMLRSSDAKRALKFMGSVYKTSHSGEVEDPGAKKTTQKKYREMIASFSKEINPSHVVQKKYRELIAEREEKTKDASLETQKKF